MISIIEDLLNNSNLVMGDVNFNGSIDVSDIVLIVNIILGTGNNISDNALTVADLNQDGIVNVADIILVVNIILGFNE